MGLFDGTNLWPQPATPVAPGLAPAAGAALFMPPAAGLAPPAAGLAPPAAGLASSANGLGLLGPVSAAKSPTVLPDDVRRRLDLADSLTREGLSYAPVASPWQGAARLADVLVGGNERNQAFADRQSAIDGVNRTFGQLLAPGSAGAAAGQDNTALHPLAAAILAPPSGTTDPQPLDADGRAGLAQAIMTDGSNPTRSAFISTYMPMAQQASAATGLDPRLILGQAAQETGWGAHAPGNNLFGLKGPGQVLPTSESIDGRDVPTSASFQTFAQPADSFAGYARFINANPRYVPMQQAQGLDAQVAALGQSGYATDPAYAAHVGAIARALPVPQGGGSPDATQGTPTAPGPQQGAIPGGLPGGPTDTSGFGLGAPASGAATGPALTNTTLAPPASNTPTASSTPASANPQAPANPSATPNPSAPWDPSASTGGTLPGAGPLPPGTATPPRPALDPAALLSVMTNPWATPQQQQIAASLYTQQAQRGRFVQYRDEDGSLFQRDLLTNESRLIQDNHAKSPDIEGYRYARSTGFTGSFADYILGVKKAQAPLLQMNNGPSATPAR